jgi:hypothetical protein
MSREPINCYHNDKGHVFADRKGVWDSFQTLTRRD